MKIAPPFRPADTIPMTHADSLSPRRRRVRLAAFLVALSIAVPDSAAARSPILKAEFIDPAPSYPQAHASTIVQLADGTLAAAWFGGTEEGSVDVAIWFARMGRRGWDKPVAVADGRLPGPARFPAWNPVLFQPPGEPLRLFYKVGADPRSWRGMVIVSKDGGRHWGTPEALPGDILGPIKNKPIIAPDGSWLSPSSREIGTLENNRWFIRMERSADHGQSWQAEPPIASPVGLEAIQPSILSFRDKRLALVARTRQGVLATSWSSDSGMTWSPLAAIDLPNPNSGIDAVSLADGRQLIVYNNSAHWPEHPGDGPRWPLDLGLSDDGVHWRHVLTLESQPLRDGYAYPAAIQTRDGLVHITYTYNRTRIRHVILDPARLR